MANPSCSHEFKTVQATNGNILVWRCTDCNSGPFVAIWQCVLCGWVFVWEAVCSVSGIGILFSVQWRRLVGMGYGQD
ncbi:hypothetical protein VTN49DRAFT_817 [Thermomyces lanuginosus]|uniref:uncharacterized protein n=1 Tax=Thermomyces lanuginosus TaxID=5541 RepID=UPI0037426714